MTKQFVKRSVAAVFATAAMLSVPASLVRAGEQPENWFEQQRSLTDGASIPVVAAPARAPEGPRSRIGEPVASPVSSIQQQNFLIEQLRRNEEPVR